MLFPEVKGGIGEMGLEGRKEGVWRILKDKSLN